MAKKDEIKITVSGGLIEQEFAKSKQFAAEASSNVGKAQGDIIKVNAEIYSIKRTIDALITTMKGIESGFKADASRLEALRNADMRDAQVKEWIAGSREYRECVEARNTYEEQVIVLQQKVDMLQAMLGVERRSYEMELETMRMFVAIQASKEVI